MTLPETVERFEAAGVDLVGLIPASEEDWDQHPGEPDGAELRRQHDFVSGRTTWNRRAHFWLGLFVG